MDGPFRSAVEVRRVVRRTDVESTGDVTGDTAEATTGVARTTAARCIAGSYLRLKKGGAIAILDNAHAYDNVSLEFLQKVLTAFGLPDSFCNIVRVMYTNVSTRLKVNDTLARPQH